MLQFEDFLREITPVNDEDEPIEMDENRWGGSVEANSSQSIHGEGPALGNSKGMAKAT